MNARLSPRPTKATSRKAALVSSLIIAATALCSVVVVWRSLPAETRYAGSRRSLPAGQLQADARTLFAALNYLLDRDLDQGWPVTPATAMPATLAAQPLGPSQMSICCLSNQAELLSEPATNLPARS